MRAYHKVMASAAYWAVRRINQGARALGRLDLAVQRVGTRHWMAAQGRTLRIGRAGL